MDSPEGLLSKLIKFAIGFALSAFLIHLGICYLMEIWWELLIIVVLIIAVFAAFRIWKSNHDAKW